MTQCSPEVAQVRLHTSQKVVGESHFQWLFPTKSRRDERQRSQDSSPSSLTKMGPSHMFWICRALLKKTLDWWKFPKEWRMIPMLVSQVASSGWPSPNSTRIKYRALTTPTHRGSINWPPEGRFSLGNRKVTCRGASRPEGSDRLRGSTGPGWCRRRLSRSGPHPALAPGPAWPCAGWLVPSPDCSTCTLYEPYACTHIHTGGWKVLKPAICQSHAIQDFSSLLCHALLHL